MLMRKAHPILFSAPMIRALLAGRKTQTRRVVKPAFGKNRPIVNLKEEGNGDYSGRFNDPDSWGYPYAEDGVNDMPLSWWLELCPYGQPGDLLWVREEHYRFGHWEPVPGIKTKTGRMKWRFVDHHVVMRDEPPVEFRKGRHHKDPSTPAWHKRLARFMPRQFSRLTLELTGVRVERLQDISAEDALAEGIARISKDGNLAKYGIPDADGLPGSDNLGWDWAEWCLTPRGAYHKLWHSINGPESWEQNTWVWVLEFKVHECNVDDLLRGK
jgi:hypothetical protein